MTGKFRVALSGDFRKEDGSPTFPDFDLEPLVDNPNIEMEFLESENPLRAEQLEDFDALIVLIHRFTRESVPKSGRLSSRVHGLSSASAYVSRTGLPMRGGDYSIGGPASQAAPCYNRRMSSENVVQELRLAHFLRGLSEADLSQLAAHLPSHEFQPGEILLNLGDPLEAVYLILNGEVELTTYDSRGESRLVNRLSAGGVAGLRDLKQLKETGAAAVITGKALLEGCFTVQEALEALA